MNNSSYTVLATRAPYMIHIDYSIRDEGWFRAEVFEDENATFMIAVYECPTLRRLVQALKDAGYVPVKDHSFPNWVDFPKDALR